jgi:hydroxymethylglutaryl-CoA lyase
MTLNSNIIRITESPRESFQATKRNVSSAEKANYINILLKAGFENIDAGSFVSHTAVPQLKDTADVLRMLDLSSSKTKIVVTVGNYKGAEIAMNFEQINSLAFLFSVSPTFLKLNTGATVFDALESMRRVNELCIKNDKTVIANICLAFGNPYDDKFIIEDVLTAVDKIKDYGINKIVLADTLACANAQIIGEVLGSCINAFPEIEFGLHLHTDEKSWESKTQAAFDAGCRNFDSVLLGLGGCPMSGMDMVSNLSTENLLNFCEKKLINNNIDVSYINKATIKAREIF